LKGSNVISPGLIRLLSGMYHMLLMILKGSNVISPGLQPGE